jgi:hypothetical protein
MLATAAITLSCASCNLDLETADYPYQVAIVIEEDTGNTTPDANDAADASIPEDAGDAGVDMAPPGQPSLVITEVLINTSFEDTALGELGEYVEIKNVGDGPADPRAISMRLTNVGSDQFADIFISTPVSQEQLEVIRTLKPIEPGDYFVFVRYAVEGVPITTTLEEGRSYDVGRFGQGASISNSGERVLELRYNDGNNIVISDRVRWRSNDLIAANGDASESLEYQEDVALTVRPEFEDPAENNTPDRWCLSGDIFGQIFGSPGSTGTCID